MNKIKLAIRDSVVFDLLHKYIDTYRTGKWFLSGQSGAPPNIVKQNTIVSYAHKVEAGTLVETGTFLGDTARFVGKFFREVYTIELSEELHKHARKLFKGKGNYFLIKGDSTQELAQLVPQLGGSVLFWLDAHYSGPQTAKGEKETPILSELISILDAKNIKPTILIDDARCFGTYSDYPTIVELELYIKKARSEATLTIINDIVVVETN
jgi:hypothetical protein